MDAEIAVLNKYLTQLESFGFSGSILVGVGEEVVFKQAYGYANVEHGIRSQTNTIYDMGSITKPFTAVAIMKLIQMGELALHGQLSDYLLHPSLTWPNEKQLITLYHLLTHTAGIEDTLEDDYKDESQHDVLHRIIKTPLLTPPGEKYRYSNDGFTLLAMIIEQVTGLEYEAFMQKHVFKPAGLKDTGYVYPKWDVSRVAHGYVNFDHQGHSLQKNYPTWSLKGNGGMLSTVEDMFRWHIALTKHTILNKETTQIMYTPYLNNSGCGWEVQQRNGQTIIAHDGASYYGSSACFYRNLTSKRTIVLFTNQSYEHMPLIKPLMHNILRIIEGDLVDLKLIERINDAPELSLKELPLAQQNQNSSYLLSNREVTLQWGRYYGLLKIGSEELLTLVSTEEEKLFIRLSKSITTDLAHGRFESFRTYFSAKEVLNQREASITKVFTDYRTKHGKINHFSVYGAAPSIRIEGTTEIRIEVKNDAIAEALYMYHFWTKDHQLQMVGFANGIKDESILLVKPYTDSAVDVQNRFISLRLHDHALSYL